MGSMSLRSDIVVDTEQDPIHALARDLGSDCGVNKVQPKIALRLLLRTESPVHWSTSKLRHEACVLEVAEHLLSQK